MSKIVSIVVLNYKNYHDTIDCIDSIFQCKYINLNVIVVDNDSKNESVDILKKKYQNKIILIASKTNLGYAGGNNIGIRKAIELKSDYICVINNDTIVEKNFIERCISALDSDKNIGIVSPIVLEYNSDVIQSTGGKIFLNKGGSELINKGKNIKEITKDQECDFISGACMFFRKEMIDINGFLPESYFLFYEETEWCYKIKKKGFLIKSICSTFIQHKGSATIDSISGLSAYLLRRNRVVFVKRNASTFKYLYFLCYLLIETLYYKFVKKRNCKGYLKSYWHGMMNIVDLKNYPFILINKKG